MKSLRSSARALVVSRSVHVGLCVLLMVAFHHEICTQIALYVNPQYVTLAWCALAGVAAGVCWLRSLVKVLFVGLHVAAAYVVVMQVLVWSTALEPETLLAPLTWKSALYGLGFYFLRMFGITAGYHRYFAHRAYRTSRRFQFALAFVACAALQKGPLWWYYTHRIHHEFSDEEGDPHSPVVGTFWHSHVGWVMEDQHMHVPLDEVDKDFAKTELWVLDRFHSLPGIMLALGCFALDGWSGLAWAFVFGTVMLYHATFMINSVCHVFGTRRYNTTDQSRNCWWAALATMGEGWHNNHHHYMSCARQGFTRVERLLDTSYNALQLLAFVGIVWDIREPTEKALQKDLIVPEADATMVA